MRPWPWPGRAAEMLIVALSRSAIELKLRHGHHRRTVTVIGGDSTVTPRT